MGVAGSDPGHRSHGRRGSGGDDDDEGSSGSESGGDLSGEINVSGSSTVEPISVAAGEVMEDNVDVVVNVEGLGTGDGFESFCAGDHRRLHASRAIDEEEAAACEEAASSTSSSRSPTTASPS